MGEKLQKNQVLYIDNTRYVVVNMVEYQEDSWIWQEYEIKNDSNQRLWLCVEKNEQGQIEYSIYSPYYGNVNTNSLSFSVNNIEYELYEKGVATVKDYFGNADVDIREKCSYIDYATKNEQYVISVEFWGREIEKSIGEYIDNSRVKITGEMASMNYNSYQGNYNTYQGNYNGYQGNYNGYQNNYNSYQSSSSNSTNGKSLVVFLCLIFFLPSILTIIVPSCSAIFVNKSIEKYLDKQSTYTYVTSVTNDSNSKTAKVYKSYYSTIDETVKDIIDGVPEGITDTIDSDPNTEEDGIGLHTKKEFAYVYMEDQDIYVQVSDKAYVNNSNGSTYHRKRHSHYYNTYRSTNESSTYSTYSRSARQDSVNSRRSSGGGTSSGK